MTSLPKPITNNAVALGEGPDGQTLLSFNGLLAGKTWRDASNAAFACALSGRSCKEIASVPVEQGRLASTAVKLGRLVYIFGGYTVAEDGGEVSSHEVFAFDPSDQSYTRVADMPTPVDDMIAVTYQDRYIYLVSGWHDTGNVSLVQVYDAANDSWQQATKFPGDAVFGHAGGIVGNTMLVVDGVAVIGVVDGRRQFGLVKQSWRGDIDPDDPLQITWRKVKDNPGPPLYRAASMGDAALGAVVIAGGSDNPYNFNGIGYNGEPSEPLDAVIAWDVASEGWSEIALLKSPSMDHRSLVKSGGRFYLVGGMGAGQEVLADVVSFEVAADSRDE